MADRKPRIWPSLLVGACVAPAVSLIVSLLLFRTDWILDSGLASSDLDDAQVESWTRAGFLVVSLAYGVLMLVAIACLARWSRQPVGDRFGLVRGRLSIWAWPLLALGSLAVNWISVSLLRPVFDDPSEYESFLTGVLGLGEGEPWIGFLIAIAVLPAVTEELVFRGYVQTRLLQRFPAWTAIGFSTVLFAMAHGELQYAVLVFPLGLWFGFVAFIAESTWPAIFLHFINNGFALAVAMAAAGRAPVAPSEPGSVGGTLLDLLPVVLFLIVIIKIVLRLQARRTSVIWSPPGSGPIVPR